MAIATFNGSPSNATLALFLSWAKALSDALTTVGVLKTADTGQIVWASVVAPPGASTYAGYEIRVLSTPAGHQVYFKIEYGNTGTASQVSIRVQVGTGSDGAGNLTGNLSQQFTLNPTGTGVSATAKACYVSGDASRVGFFLFAPTMSGNAFGMALLIGRSKDTNGTDTDAYANIIIQSGTSLRQQLLPKVALGGAFPSAAAMQNVMCDFPPTGGTTTWAMQTGVFPVIPNEGWAGNPTLEAVIYAVADYPVVGTTIDVTLYGATHRFIACSGASDVNLGVTVNGNANAAGVAIRYE